MIRTPNSALIRLSLGLTLSVALILTGCNKGGVSPGGGGGGGGTGATGGPNGGPTLNGSAMVLGTLDGVDFVHVSDGSGDVISYGSIFPFQPYTYMAGVLDTQSGDTYNFFFGNIDTPNPPTAAQFSSFFAAGPRPIVDVQIGLEQGVELEYVDANLTNWRTSCGPADQTGSSFTITAIESISGGPTPMMRIVGLFTATFYECGGSGVKEVTDGRFRLDITNG